MARVEKIPPAERIEICRKRIASLRRGIGKWKPAQRAAEIEHAEMLIATAQKELAKDQHIAQ